MEETRPETTVNEAIVGETALVLRLDKLYDTLVKQYSEREKYFAEMLRVIRLHSGEVDQLPSDGLKSKLEAEETDSSNRVDSIQQIELVEIEDNEELVEIEVETESKTKIEKEFATVFETIPMSSSYGQSNHAVVHHQSSQTSASFSLDPKIGNHLGISNTYADATQPEKLAFPRFHGDKIQEWLLLVEQFFEISQTPDEFKVCLASIHFDGLATAWHQSISQSILWEKVRYDWGIYKMLLQGKYYKLVDDVIAELKQLHETEGIEEYHAQFELIKSRVTLSEPYLVKVYLEGLSFDTQKNVRMFQPQTIQQCLVIGRLYEYVHPVRVVTKTDGDDYKKGAPSLNVPSEVAGPSLGSGSSIHYKGILSSKPEPHHKTVLLPIMEKPRDTTSQPRKVDCDDLEEERVEKVALEETNATTHLSVHALSGVSSYRTMRVKGSYGKQVLYVLIDSGSTHNFMDSKVAEKLKCVLKPASMTQISVTDGRMLGVNATINKFQWEFRGTPFQADMMVIPLGGCDMVLGGQWLETLGPITRDFKKLEMQFRIGHKKVLLQGIRQGSIRNVKSVKLNKLREDQVQLSMLSFHEVPAEDMILVCSSEAKHQSSQAGSKGDQQVQQASSDGVKKLLQQHGVICVTPSFSKTVSVVELHPDIADQQHVVAEALSPLFVDFYSNMTEFCEQSTSVKSSKWKQRLSPKSWMFKYKPEKEWKRRLNMSFQCCKMMNALQVGWLQVSSHQTLRSRFSKGGGFDTGKEIRRMACVAREKETSCWTRGRR